MKKRKTYEISVIDKTFSKMYSDLTKFYTSDTALELFFYVKEAKYDFDSAEIILLNVDDRSLVTRPVSKSAEGFTYELEDDILAHYGQWKCQLKFNEGGEIYVSSPVSFRIENDLSNDRPPQLTEVNTWKNLREIADKLIIDLQIEQDETLGFLENRQDTVESKFDLLQQEMTEKDVISAPEIIAARNGEANLKARLDKEQQEVDAQLAQTVNKADISSSEYTPAIKMDLKDFSGYNQAFHPSVIYIQGGFAGYDYWMVQTPWPNGGQPYRDRWEVPIVYKSNDGENWITVADPLDDLTPSEIENRDYMSDPHMVFREDTRTLEVWYRYTENISGLPTNIIRKTTTDGENWSEREEMVLPKSYTDSDFMRSPSIIWNNQNKVYRTWYQNNRGIWYNTSPDGKNWGTQEQVSLDVTRDTWHLDVNYYRGKYHLLSYTRTPDSLAYYVSDDGVNFSFVRILLAKSDGHDLYSGRLYRSISLLDRDDKVRVYFSSENVYGKHGVGMIVANSIEEMQPNFMMDGNKILLNGEKISDAVKVYPLDYFNGENNYNDFPVGVISRNMVSNANLSGLPSDRGGLLITDRTASKSMSESETFTLQTFVERGRASTGEDVRMYFRGTGTQTPIGFADWHEIPQRKNGDEGFLFLYNSSNLSVPTSQLTPLKFDTLSAHGGEADFAYIDSSGDLRVSRDGVYQIEIKMIFEENSVGVRAVDLENKTSRTNALSEWSTTIDVNFMVYKGAGTIIRIGAYQNSGSNLNLLCGSNTTSVRIRKV